MGEYMPVPRSVNKVRGSVDPGPSIRRKTPGRLATTCAMPSPLRAQSLGNISMATRPRAKTTIQLMRMASRLAQTSKKTASALIEENPALAIPARLKEEARDLSAALEAALRRVAAIALPAAARAPGWPWIC